MLLVCFEARHESGGVSLNMQHEAGSLRKTQTMCVFVFLKSTLFISNLWVEEYESVL